jgi:hypothetical protein
VTTFSTASRARLRRAGPSGPGRGRAQARGIMRGNPRNGQGCRAVGGWGRGRARRCGAAAWPAALAWERTARATAAAPLPRTRRQPGHPPSRTPLPRQQERPGRPPRAGHPVAAKARRQGRCGLRPAASASLAAQAQTLDRELPRQDLAPAGRTGKNRGPRNQAERSNVQAHMRRVCCVIAAAVASVSILVGCSGQSGPHQTVTGLLVRVGGPAPGSPVPLPGTVVARNAAGGQFTTTTGNDGLFQLSLPLGTYRLTGHSPQVMVNNQQELCVATRAVHVTRRKSLHNIWVVCSIP